MRSGTLEEIKQRILHRPEMPHKALLRMRLEDSRSEIFCTRPNELVNVDHGTTRGVVTT